MLAARFVGTQRMSRAGHIQQIGVQVIGLLSDDADKLADHGGGQFRPTNVHGIQNRL